MWSNWTTVSAAFSILFIQLICGLEDGFTLCSAPLGICMGKYKFFVHDVLSADFFRDPQLNFTWTLKQSKKCAKCLKISRRKTHSVYFQMYDLPIKITASRVVNRATEILMWNMQASEFEQEFAVRLEEKTKLKAVNCKGIRFKIKTTPGGWTTSRKISAILQAQVMKLQLSLSIYTSSPSHTPLSSCPKTQ